MRRMSLATECGEQTESIAFELERVIAKLESIRNSEEKLSAMTESEQSEVHSDNELYLRNALEYLKNAEDELECCF